MYRGFAALVLVFCVSAYSQSKQVPDVSSWSKDQVEISLHQIVNNIHFAASLPGSVPGNVIAAPGEAFDSKHGQNQDYKFHWVRDGALVTRTLIKMYRYGDLSESLRMELRRAIENYLKLSETHQKNAVDLGEPKFKLDGHPFDGGWGRPQNDGPALRSISVMDWLDVMRSEGHKSEAGKLFESLVIIDLNYLVQVAEEKSFDMWEEVFADHYSISLLQMQALSRGADLAGKLGFREAADKYNTAAAKIRNSLLKFYSEDKGHILNSLNQSGGHIWDKQKNLDIAVILSVLYSGADTLNEWVMATAEKLKTEFIELYPINSSGFPGYVLGRYPEDVYFGGNPWPIATLGMAELHYVMASELSAGRKFVVTPRNIEFLQRLVPGKWNIGETVLPNSNLGTDLKNALLAEADLILSRVRFHMGADGEMYEQFHRVTGELTALPHLTWSYAAMLDALVARKRTIKKPQTCEALLENPNFNK